MSRIIRSSFTLFAFLLGSASPVRVAYATDKVAKCDAGLASSREIDDEEALRKMKDALKANEKFLWVPEFPRTTLDPFYAEVRLAKQYEEDALLEYCQGTLINQALRGHHDVHFRAVDPEPLAPLISSLDTALPQLFPYEGVSFRGESMNPATLSGLKIGDVLTDAGFTSTSLDFQRANSFEARFQGLDSILLVIYGRSGRIIPGSFYRPKEWQVLFPRNSARRILEIGRTKSGKPLLFVRE